MCPDWAFSLLKHYPSLPSNNTFCINFLSSTKLQCLKLIFSTTFCFLFIFTPLFRHQKQTAMRKLSSLCLRAFLQRKSNYMHQNHKWKPPFWTPFLWHYVQMHKCRDPAMKKHHLFLDVKSITSLWRAYLLSQECLPHEKRNTFLTFEPVCT